MESFDDKVFQLNQRILRVAERAVQHLEEIADENPVKVIGALKAVTQVIESAHRTNKTAYDPTSMRPDNTTNILSLNVRADDNEVANVAEILLTLQQKALDAGVDPNIIEGEIEDA
jgi:nucleotide-binding universal stress UspA family protein